MVEPFLRNLLLSSRNRRDLEAGLLAHGLILELWPETSSSSSSSCSAPLCSLLVQIYSRCDAPQDADSVFQRMEPPQRKHVHAWNAMIKSLSKNQHRQGHHHPHHAISLFQQMQQEGVRPQQASYVCAISAAAKRSRIFEGAMLHCIAMAAAAASSAEAEAELGRDLHVGNALVTMYCRCGRIGSASRVLLEMPERDVVSWTAILSAHSRRGEADRALRCFHQMLEEGIAPNKVTFVSLLSAVACPEFLSIGIRLHASWAAAMTTMRSSSSPDPSSDSSSDSSDLSFGNSLITMFPPSDSSDLSFGNSLITMYGKCGRIHDARSAFDRMPRRDVVSCNAAIAACSLNGGSSAALRIFAQHVSGCDGIEANATTFASALCACASFDEASLVHASIVGASLAFDVFVGTTLVNAYGKCRSCADAESVFSAMPEKNEISWNAMIAAYNQLGKPFDALRTAKAMEMQGVMPTSVTIVSILEPCGDEGWLTEGLRVHVCILGRGLGEDIAVANALISMYGKCKEIEKAESEFSNLHRRDVVSWTSMMKLRAHEGHGAEVLRAFEKMQAEGTAPDEVAYVAVLYACARHCKLPAGGRVYSCAAKQGYDKDASVTAVAISMYGRCGKVDEARSVFDRASDPNAVLWTSIIAAHAYNGQGKESVDLFGLMKRRFVPDEIAYLCILAACSHAGLIDEGNHFLHCMKNEADLSSRGAVDLYGCAIDLLGRAGQLEEAEALLETMPREPSIRSSTALLGACRHPHDLACAERAWNRAIGAGSKCSSLYVMLSNIYANNGIA